jgi:hypothetical protein
MIVTTECNVGWLFFVLRTRRCQRFCQGRAAHRRPPRLSVIADGADLPDEAPRREAQADGRVEGTERSRTLARLDAQCHDSRRGAVDEPVDTLVQRNLEFPLPTVIRRGVNHGPVSGSRHPGPVPTLTMPSVVSALPRSFARRIHCQELRPPE